MFVVLLPTKRLSVQRQPQKIVEKCIKYVQSYIKTPEGPQWHHSGISVNFKFISPLFLVFSAYLLFYSKFEIHKKIDRVRSWVKSKHTT